jgi:hypothetical protein
MSCSCERNSEIIRTEFLSKSTRLSQSLATIERLARLGGAVQDTMSVLKAISCRTTLTTFQDRRVLLLVVLGEVKKALTPRVWWAEKVDLPLCPLYKAA